MNEAKNMNKKKSRTALTLTASVGLLACLASCTLAQVQTAAPTLRTATPTLRTATLDIDLARRGAAIPPTFGGLMTEEINHSYDGGLYAELIQNRSFQDPASRGRQAPPSDLPVHWSVIGNGRVSLDRTEPVNSALPVSLRLDLTGGAGSVANDGYWGIPVRPNTEYRASFYAKTGSGFAGPVTASLLTDDGVTVARAATQSLSGGWRRYTVTLKTSPTAPATTKARFALSAIGTGSVTFSLVSLFPPTYQNVSNGLRPDLMHLMAELHPAFIRLPGGNYVEGNTFDTRFNWKQMIGPIAQRPGHMGCWGYRSSDGFGLPEYLLWCRQLKAEPVLALFAGYVLNGNHVDGGSPEMAQYTQEALEEIEYVSGPVTSEWGRKRAADGFPKPFALHYVEVGNEDGYDRSGSYEGRFTEMAKAIRAKYPKLKIIATALVKGFTPDLYDDHFYRSASQLMILARQYAPPAGNSPPLRFDGVAWNGRQPAGLQTFVGEWASQEGRPTPNLSAALGDAAFIMGMEQNADTIPLECYAPLLVNVNPADPEKGYPGAWQWATNLIGYDALHSFGSPSYYAQSLLAKNRGDVALPSTFTVLVPKAAPGTAAHGSVGVGVWHTQADYTDFTVTAPNGHSLLPVDPTAVPGTWQTTGGGWETHDGALRPTTGDAESWAITGDPQWTDYTIRLRARKIAGQEGFVVLFHALGSGDYRWWNVGGWGNTLARTEASANGTRSPYGPATPFVVETGRWYDLRLEISGRHIRGFVDGKLVTDTSEEPIGPSVPAIATVTYAQASHSVFIKVVNAGSEPIDAAIHLRGVGQVEPRGTATVLAGDLEAVNTLDQPTHVAPRTEAVTNGSASFRRTFPPHSFTLLRMQVR